MKKKIAIVGGGSCALMLACELDTSRFDVDVYEKNSATGRKFLVAGQGGLNITHSEAPEKFIERYTPNHFLKKAFSHFNNQRFISWLNEKGIDTLVGSSKRVFPLDELKPVEVLNRLLNFALEKNVRFHYKQQWSGFSESGELLFSNEEQAIKADYVIFCLGGASWPVTGSNELWKEPFIKKNIVVVPFEPSNCSFGVKWPELLIDKIDGKALKNISARCSDHTHEGEIVLTKTGMEGSGIYPLSPQIRAELHKNKKAIVHLDLKPSFSIEKIVAKLNEINEVNNYTEKVKRVLNLPNFQVQMLKAYLSKEEFLDAKTLASKIKDFALTVNSTGELENAISTVGGISLEEINDHFELLKLPRHFAIGEMLDYDAPTGGYLLQSCFSMANYLAHHLNAIN